MEKTLGTFQQAESLKLGNMGGLPINREILPVYMNIFEGMPNIHEFRSWRESVISKSDVYARTTIVNDKLDAWQY